MPPIAVHAPTIDKPKRYRLLAGTHTDDDPTGVEKVRKAQDYLRHHTKYDPDDPERIAALRQVEIGPGELTYYAGTVFESFRDLLPLNANHRWPKFEEVHEPTQPRSEDQRRPNETMAEFIARLQALESATQQPPTPSTPPENPVPNKPEPGASPQQPEKVIPGGATKFTQERQTQQSGKGR